ncbi:HOP2 [Scenedesmus sp. PABB004]|nr:HOP2 [Scenedesmus sp. PABB004]
MRGGGGGDRGGGERRGKRKQTHEFDDQFGSWAPQDREEHSGFTKGTGGTGGGTAGKKRVKDTALNFTRQLPKFLAPYAHMLPTHAAADEDEPVVVQPGEARRRAADDQDDADDDAADEQEAIRRALEENPELAEQLGTEALTKVEAGREKELGNKAFAAKDFEAALKHFDRCVELDPGDAVYFSNRSAAAANLGRFDAALADARAAAKLRPGWVKAHARCGAAYMGLQLYSEAKEAYERAVKLEPDDQARRGAARRGARAGGQARAHTLRAGAPTPCARAGPQTLRAALDRASALELQNIRERKHVFKKAKPGGGGGSGGGQKQQPDRQRDGGASANKQAAGAAAGGGGGGAAKVKQKAKLSFAMDDEEEEQ